MNAATPAQRHALDAADLQAAIALLDRWHEYAPGSLMRLWAAGRIRRSGREADIARLEAAEAREVE